MAVETIPFNDQLNASDPYRELAAERSTIAHWWSMLSDVFVQNRMRPSKCEW